MTPEKVIQDSDDEDDALSDVATSIDPLQEHEHEQHEEDYANAQTDHGDEPYEQEMRTADPVVTGSQLGVNFDDFLQSQPQMAGEHGPSSSQVKREERWIPAESGNESDGECVRVLSVMVFISQWLLLRRRLSRCYDERNRSRTETARRRCYSS